MGPAGTRHRVLIAAVSDMSDIQDHADLRMVQVVQKPHPILHGYSVPAEVLDRDDHVGSFTVARQFLIALPDHAALGIAGVTSPHRTAQFGQRIELALAVLDPLPAAQLRVDIVETGLVRMVGGRARLIPSATPA